ncbi:MAG: Crp/Fnr family transcriptional regulator [Betaproteobacteria bacterium]|nr:MAG: Crp/Fnr family transcriptional regulator [Betaproteobacteria bacterium]
MARNENLILAAIPERDYRQLVPQLEIVALRPGETLYAEAAPIGLLYFPVGSIISLLSASAAGDTAEIALVGNEGMVGVSALLGGNRAITQSVVHSAGKSRRVGAGAFVELFERSPGVRKVIMRYLRSVLVQAAQSAFCHRHHSLEQRLCRWLLQSVDRMPSHELYMTQELMGVMLGVRREAVTLAAARLQASGALRYSRGHLTVLRRDTLEKRACECYAALKVESERLLRDLSEP